MANRQLSPKVQEKLSQKRLIFTVTTGRSGTNYMTNMLSYLPGVLTSHEPKPHLHLLLRETQSNPDVAFDLLINEKLPFIADLPGATYIETSHLICKGFLEPMLDLGVKLDLVILRRDPRAVATSLYQLGHIPARTQVGRQFLLQPDDPGVLAVSDWESLHDYQLTFWYTLEIERRAQEYRDKFRDAGSQVVEITLEEFSTVLGYYRFLNTMKLPFPTLINIIKHLRSHFRRVNNKDKLKEKQNVEDFDALEAEVFSRIAYNPLDKVRG